MAGRGDAPSFLCVVGFSTMIRLQRCFSEVKERQCDSARYHGEIAVRIFIA